MSETSGTVTEVPVLEHWYLSGQPWLSLRRLCSYYYFAAKRKLRLDYSFDPPGPSETPIDIFIPTIDKDAAMLEYCLKGVRKFVSHPISMIYIVAPDNSRQLRQLADKYDCTFVPEEGVIPIKKGDINYSFKDENRNGWIYKMLLNLAADQICQERYILILDADTVFISPQIFMHQTKPLFNLSDEFNKPYFEANKRLLGLKHRLSRSFITHYMLFDAMVLKQLRDSLEQKWQQPWYQAISDNLDRSVQSSFADYEIYGDYYTLALQKPAILNYWSNVSLSIDALPEFDRLAKEYTNGCRSISLHNYKR